jgi:hypothetical protein
MHRMLLIYMKRSVVITHSIFFITRADVGYQVFDRTGCSEVNRLLLKLCENFDTLPTSLFVTGIKRLDAEAMSGGGFADIYRGSLRNEVVALKRLRIFLNDQEHQKLHRVFHVQFRNLGLIHPCLILFSGYVERL